ncbi:MAG: hypothetical protein AABY02_01520 [Nanoarchaeota archaeon]
MKSSRAISWLAASIFALSSINGCAFSPREHYPRLNSQDLRERLDPRYKFLPKGESRDAERAAPHYLENYSTGEREYIAPNIERAVGELIKRYIKNNYEKGELPHVILKRAEIWEKQLRNWTKLNIDGWHVSLYASNNQIGLRVSDED